MVIAAYASHIIGSAADLAGIIAAGKQLFIITANTAYARAAAGYCSCIIAVGRCVFVVAADAAHIFAAVYCAGVIADADRRAAVIAAAVAARVLVSADSRGIVATRYGSFVDTAQTSGIIACGHAAACHAQIFYDACVGAEESDI